MTEPYPCYCPTGLAGCDEPYVHCDRLRAQRDRIRDALADYFEENAPAWWSENTATALAPVIEQLCWEKAGEELRRAAEVLHRNWTEVALGGASYVRDVLLDHAGTLDGGARA